MFAFLLIFSPPLPLASQQGDTGSYDSSRNTPGGFLNNYDSRGNPSAQSPDTALGSAGSSSQSSRPVDLNTLSAREEFRLGVQAYNRFAYNEAILSFERALAYRPGEPLILDWLGRSYYRSGFEDTALRQWQAALQGYPYGTASNLLLANHIDTIRNRRSLLPVPNDDVRYVESGTFPSHNNTIVLYKQPTSILALEDGSVYVVAYGSNEIVRIDVNGIIRQRIRGPVNGFDRPYDIVRGEGGKLYVSEYRGGRVSVLNSEGVWQSYIGSKGHGDGKFVSPQNMTIDEEGYLYVVDYGNRRVSKFGPDGNFILTFGTRSAGFQGFLSPTGIAAREGRIYIADNLTKQISMFDRNGAYLGVLVKDGLTGPESLRFLKDGRLLAADMNRILMIDGNSSIIRELGVLGNSRVRIVCAEMDQNGNVIAANFSGDEVSIFTRIDDVASGLFVEIERVFTDDFPRVTVEIQVQDRLRRPIVGLDGRNFFLTEGGRTVSAQNFRGAGYVNNLAYISILMERSDETRTMQEALEVALRDISAVSNSAGADGIRVASLISAGEQPVRERLDGSVPPAAGEASGSPVLSASLQRNTGAGIENLTRGALASLARGNAASYSPRWRLDLGLRLAATDLLAGGKKRGIIYVGSGKPGQLAFEQYSLSELAAYLANNSIVFHAVVLGNAQIAPEIRYLCEQTGGRALPLYQNEGIGKAISKLAEQPSGSYTLSYQSMLPTDFGRAYLPLEAEVYLMERSGRDMIGYYPPLE
ncbi:MAG: 6-bladed beta-propeller [Treponema sp.]|nr:6-bladed beta-propeller [Treponema sp.]